MAPRPNPNPNPNRNPNPNPDQVAAALDRHGALVARTARWRQHGACYRQYGAPLAAALAAGACAAAALLFSDEGECDGYFAQVRVKG